MVHNTDLFTCGVCGHNEDSLVEFLKHKLQHRGPGKSFVCQLCSISYTKEITLKHHYKEKHKIQLYHRKTVARKFLPRETNLDLDVNSLQSIDHSSIDENIDVDILFDETTADKSINIDHDYEKNENDSLKLQNTDIFHQNGNEENEISQSGIVPAEVQESFEPCTNPVGMEFLQLKPNNDLTLCYGNPVVVNSSEGLIHENSLIQRTQEDVNNLMTCNVEIISLDEPNTDLHIDDSGQKPEEYLDDDKTEELDFLFYVRNDVHVGRRIEYGRQDLCCIYCDFKDMFLANLFQHMCDNHQDHMNVFDEAALQVTDDNVKLMKFSEYKKLCCERKLETTKKSRSTETQDLAGEYACIKCDKVFTRIRYLKKHIELHKTDKPYLCDFCGKSFKTKTYLMIHHRSHDKRSFKCEQCDFTSSNPSQIRLHRQQHNEGCVLCDICGNAYSDKSTLTKHKRVHDPSRPYQCNYPGCTWRFLTEVMCRAHQRNHDTEGKFKCSFCGYAFRHKHHVKRHEARMHGSCLKNNKTHPTEINDTSKTGDEMSSVNVVIETTMEEGCMQDSAPSGQLVITTDSEGNALNYQLTDISNVALMGSEQGRTIIIPQIDYGNIVLQRVDHSDGDSSLIKVTTLKDDM